MSPRRPDAPRPKKGTATGVTPIDIVRGSRALPVRMGKYNVVSHLATGGMAEIFLAKQGGVHGFEKHVVLKQIRPRLAEDPSFVEMFLDEARLAARLQHQNIAQVYDIGEENGAYFFTMEYLHGDDLRAVFREAETRAKRIPIEQALAIVAGAAAGLHYAHERKDDSGKPLKIVHRDVSPSNIVVTQDGGVKLVDFGIARTTAGRAETQSGSLKGKLAYMAPEQCLDDELDRRTDIFSLGIVLYELSTTRRLFRHGHESDYLVMNRIVHGDFPPPSAVVPDYPDELEKIVMRALAIAPDARYQTAEEMLTDIESFARAQGITMSSPSLAAFAKELLGERPEPWQDAFSCRDADATVRDIPVAPPGDFDTREHSTAGLRILAKGRLRRANSTLSILRPMPSTEKPATCRAHTTRITRPPSFTEVDVEPSSTSDTTLFKLDRGSAEPARRTPRRAPRPSPVQPARAHTDPEPRRVPWVPLAFVVACIAGVLLVFHALGVLGADEAQPGDQAKPQRGPVIEPTVVAIEPGDSEVPPAEEAAKTPAATSPAKERSSDGEQRKENEVEPPAAASDAEDEAAATEAEDEPAPAAEPARASEKRRSATRPKRSTKRRGKKRKAPSSTAPARREKPTWDPNSPLPPSHSR